MGKTGGYLSHPKLPNLLLGLIVFFATTQLGLHLWPLSSLVYGIRIDYLSPTLYFLDLLIVAYLGLQFRSLSAQAVLRKRVIGTFAALPILLTNILFSANPLSTLSWSLHLLLYILFANTLSLRLISSSYFLVPLTIATFFQVALAAIQVILGHSVGGLLYYLGERIVAVGSPAIATATFMGETVLRGYATFGHPNVLAGWLVVSLLILVKVTTTKKLIINNWILVSSTIATIVGVLLTQSRAATLTLFGVVIPFYLIKTLKSKIMYFTLLAIPISYFLFPTLLSPSRSDLSFSERHTLQGVSLSVIRSLPIFGAGAQASITTYPTLTPNTRLLQPDHNSFTLFLSWFGVLGTLVILYSLRHLIPNFYFLIPLIPLLLLDHYFLTSPQGLFILLLYAKLTSCSK